MSKSKSKNTIGTDGGISISFCLSLYSETAIKKAALKFADLCSIHLSKNENEVTATLFFAGEESSQTRDQIRNALMNEVLDQDLREKISSDTEGLRNLILAHAFSRTGLTGSE